MDYFVAQDLVKAAYDGCRVQITSPISNIDVFCDRPIKDIQL
jgi:hypothetical protein